MTQITVYTDGSCKGNGKENSKGGWGYVINMENEKITDFGGERSTTNQVMELKAMLFALRKIFSLPCENKTVQIYTDSAYVKRGIVGNDFVKLQDKSGWIYRWKEKGWKNSKNYPIKNKDLWIDIYDVVQKIVKCNRDIKINWVKGHSNNSGNDEADKLANEGVKYIDLL